MFVYAKRSGEISFIEIPKWKEKKNPIMIILGNMFWFCAETLEDKAVVTFTDRAGNFI